MVKNVVRIGWILTFFWILIIVFLIIKNPIPSTLNEMGDFIAGVSSPLAFLWVVVGYYQSQQALVMQAEELSQNTRALTAQVEEMKKTTEIQEEQLSEMKMQYEELKLKEQIKMQPFFDIKFSYVIEEYDMTSTALHLQFEIKCIKGIGRMLHLSFSDINSESNYLSYFKEGDIDRVMIKVDLGELSKLNNERLDIVYYDVNHMQVRQRYRFFHNEIDKNIVTFEKIILS